jgi:hypothetical protein
LAISNPFELFSNLLSVVKSKNTFVLNEIKQNATFEVVQILDYISNCFVEQ